MFILLTTANFPTIMLPSYNQQRIDAWFFIIYLVVGLFLLLNLLLAIFYESYQTQTYVSIDSSTSQRSAYIANLFIQLDEEQKGYLDHDQGRILLEEIHVLILGLNERPENYDMGVTD